MLQWLILITIPGAALSAPSTRESDDSRVCTVSDWGEWSKCRQGCSKDGPMAFPVSKQMKAIGRGREAMSFLKEMKLKQHEQNTLCKQMGICPELFAQPSITGQEVSCSNGYAGEYPCYNVHLLSYLNFADLGYDLDDEEGNDMWVWHDEANGDDYAIMGLYSGSSFIRITDPVNPEVLGTLDTHTERSTWRDIKVIGDYAYIVSEAPGHGMQVFDLKQLRGRSANAEYKFEETTHYSAIGQSHNIVANPASERVFIVGATQSSPTTGNLCRGGLHIVDVSDPLNPTFAGCFEEDGYTHDAQCVIYDGPDKRFTNHEICFCYNEDSLAIADVTDANKVVMISDTAYPGSEYSHQGWATPNLNYLLLDDELDEYNNNRVTLSYIWNIMDLKRPTISQIYESSELAIDHNQYIDDQYISHQANYEAGYRLLDIYNPMAPREVGYIDIFPSGTENEFNGAWSNYPWLKHRQQHYQYTVVSSINHGLFIVRPDWRAIQAERESTNTSNETTIKGKTSRFRETVYAEKGARCPILSQSEDCVPKNQCF